MAYNNMPPAIMVNFYKIDPHWFNQLKLIDTLSFLKMIGLINLPYFIEYNAHTSIVRTWISQWFLAKKLFLFFKNNLQELIIASLFIITAILKPF